MKSVTTVIAAALAVSCGSGSTAPLSQKQDIEPAIIRGTKIDPIKVKPVIIYTASGSGCTGTFVSKDTFLTAAHCVGSSSVGKGKRYDGVQVEFKSCIQNPAYRGNSTADHAICKVTEGQLTEAVAAVIETELANISPGQTVRQVGGGCSVWGGGGFGTMQWALEKVTRIPKQDTASSRDITTLGQPGSDTPGAPCSGDSGGALFAVVRDAAGAITEALGKYLAVTSRSDTRTQGYFSSLVFESDQAWLLGLEPKGYKVCGITSSAELCQTFGETPPPTPTPTPPGPTPSPTPLPPVPSVNSCKGALKLLDAKLFHKPYGDASAELKLLANCNVAFKPLPETASAVP